LNRLKSCRMGSAKASLILLLVICMLTVFLAQSYLENTRLKVELEELQTKHASLQSEYNDLQTNYTILQSEYVALNTSLLKVLSDYTSLMGEYKELNSSYQQLLAEYSYYIEGYNALLQRYRTLNSTYEQILSEYNRLYAAFYEPLRNKKVPTLDELEEWLAQDPTDGISYRYPEFICGDFAVMLSLHAKLKGWDMGIVAILGKRSDGGEFNHAFNVIICQDGTTYYIEPQTDKIFTGPIPSTGWFTYEGFSEPIKVYVEELIIVVLY